MKVVYAVYLGVCSLNDLGDAALVVDWSGRCISDHIGKV